MTVRVERTEGVLRVVLDRPDKANALTAEMLEAVRDAVRGASGDVLILTGAGKVFSAGADLEAARAGLAVSPLWEDVSGAIAKFPGLTLAALNGSCAGGAMGMMLACDCRITVPEASFFYPVMKMGYLPQPSDPGRLAALVGPARAKMILVGAAKIGAAEALAMGLVDRIAEDLTTEIEGLAAVARAAPEGHTAAVKAMIPV
ncbi:enoyl-CoA hydratase/isomerase family protein [Palleronia abyssalis]|uniref:Putative enoyl-CoA hydratase echA6 n=1 Tax=Palleronia abyssalis TaxID=1501240 RepID=A0A2R8BTF5_9RHOB|nr:enoyl-CoA hydratase/isomerase family protein [Palleronia abyssalis]SPJ23459.1 putative enoyl-CoA hydratase echA6 [Palleronia abyssalis]